MTRTPADQSSTQMELHGLTGDPSDGGFVRVNLLQSFDELCRLLGEQIRWVATTQTEATAGPSGAARTRLHDVVLDCYLLAAGMTQILEDYLDDDLLSLGKVSTRLRPLAGPLGPSASRAVVVLSRTAGALRARRRRKGPLREALYEIVWVGNRLSSYIADDVLADERAGDHSIAITNIVAEDVLVRTRRLLCAFEQAPRSLRQAIMRLPNCFQSFDQQPADCLRIVERFMLRWPDRNRPIIVVGVRTSGSYLAPLYVSFLASAGYLSVTSVTTRPGQPGRLEARELQAAARHHALALVVDDPPRTGKQLALVSAMLEGLGLHPILAIQHFGRADSLPSQLRTRDSVTLGWHEWAICRALNPQLVGDVLEEAGAVRRFCQHAIADHAGVTVTEVAHVQTLQPRRGHIRAIFRVGLSDGTGSRGGSAYVCAEGVGLGYFGRQPAAVADALVDFIPDVYATGHGLLFRAWMPEEMRLTAARLGGDVGTAAAKIAEYVDARARLLPMDQDNSLRIRGNDAAWEHVGQMLSEAYGKGRYLARIGTNGAARQLIRAERSSLIDGRVELSQWFGTGADPACKVDFYEGTFSTTEYYSYDPVFDLARAAAMANLDNCGRFEFMIRHHYESCSGGSAISPERWLLYRLLHLVHLYRDSLERVATHGGRDECAYHSLVDMERTTANLARTYVEDIYFRDLDFPHAGPLCAIDIDGVLETRWLGSPIIGPSGALAIRTLNLHGYRGLLATGRSLMEVRERCRAYRLVGGVAEYGSVVYVQQRDSSKSLLTSDDEAALLALRTAVERRPGLYIDPAFRNSVRVQRIDPTLGRRGLPAETISDLLEEAQVMATVRAIPGVLQTDFTAAKIDKGRGLLALAAELGGGIDSAARFLSFAVGDSDSDVAMFKEAQRAYAPANATAAAQSAAKRVRHPGPIGLLAAVRSELGAGGMDRGSCAPGSADADVLLHVLAAAEGGRARKIREAVALSTRFTLVGVF
jgi:hydroxymethylpyrimidine pyrophosphatase-like HAD family hydrolase